MGKKNNDLYSLMNLDTKGLSKLAAVKKQTGSYCIYLQKCRNNLTLNKLVMQMTVTDRRKKKKKKKKHHFKIRRDVIKDIQSGFK